MLGGICSAFGCSFWKAGSFPCWWLVPNGDCDSRRSGRQPGIHLRASTLRGGPWRGSLRFFGGHV